MSDDVTGVTLQVTEKMVSAGVSAYFRVMEAISRLFRELLAMERNKQALKGQSGIGAKDKISQNGSEASDLAPGYVRYRDMIQNARKSGDTLVTSENGLTKADMKAISKRAQKYGIPVAFTNPKGKENIYACVRKSDLPVFKQICAETIKQNITEKSDQFKKIKCQDWQIPFLTAEMKNFDVPAMFPQSREHGAYCLFDVKHEARIKNAFDEFTRKAGIVQKKFAIDRDEEGFYTIKDLRTGKEISFENVPARKDLMRQMQAKFGLDENTVGMCAAKFGEDMLSGTEKKSFFQSKAGDEFSRIEPPLELKGESPLVKAYQCWYLTPREDGKPRVVFRDDKTGDFAVLEPHKMSRKQMRSALSEQLGITDKAVLDALTEKADRISNYYAKEDAANYRADRQFTFDDWQESNLKVYTHTGVSGEEYSTKLKPVDSVQQMIRRINNDDFTLDCTFHSTAINEKGVTVEKEKSTKLELSLSDRKTGLRILTEMYKEQGIPEATAKQMATEVYQKAKQQNTDRILQLEEVRADAMRVAFGDVSTEITTTDKQAAAAKVAEQFGIPAEAADAIVEKASEIRTEAVQQRVDAVRAEAVNFSAAMNHMTDREQLSIDSMIVCSADAPEKHIVVTGDHNGDRVVHNYDVYNGSQKLGSYSDEHTTDADGQAVRSVDGKTTAWTALKKEMQEQSGINPESVLTFRSEEEYKQYLEDTKQLSESQKENVPEIKPETEKAGVAAIGNGHEKHTAPTQKLLDDASAKPTALPTEPKAPEMPVPHRARKH